MPAHVGIVERDRRAHPVSGKYNICYVNGFQTQADEKRFWHRHWSLVLKRDGRPVVDSVWGEWLLDIRTTAKRTALARIMGRWTARCAHDGFDAVEYDNLDSFSRSHRLVTRADARAYAALLVRRAHRHDSRRPRRTGPSGTAPPSASTSRSPSSAPSTTSAAATSPATGATCWPWSTAARRSTGPAGTGATRSPSYDATST